MSLRFVTGSLVFFLLAAACGAGAAAADPTAARLAPDAVMAGAAPGEVKLTLMNKPADGAAGLKDASHVVVGTKMVVAGAKDAASVTFTPPRHETAKDEPVSVYDASAKLLATAQLRYVAPGDGGIGFGLGLTYILLILSFPLILMVGDMVAAYLFARKTRLAVLDKAAMDGLNAEELRLLLSELSQSPPGIPGLARNSIAFLLMMILAVAIVHLLVVDPPGAREIPQTVDRILVLLTGLLTSVVSFYFGAKAVETGAQMGNLAAGGQAGGNQAMAMTFSPPQGAPGTAVTIAGRGFGSSPGSVEFGSASATVTSWSDTSIVVSVPSAATGAVRLTVKPAGGPAQTSASTFTILDSGFTIAPQPGQAGKPTTLTGTGFGSAVGTVLFNGQASPAAASQWSDTQIVIVAPARGMYTVDVQPANAAAQVRVANRYLVM